MSLCLAFSQQPLSLSRLEQPTDDQVAVPMVKGAQTRFGNVHSMSFDKGFHSPDNQRVLREIRPMGVLPKKGHRSADEKARETAAKFVRLRHQHSAVEPAINALEQHGLDICPDHGITGFKRYVALAALARNLHRLGTDESMIVYLSAITSKQKSAEG